MALSVLPRIPVVAGPGYIERVRGGSGAIRDAWIAWYGEALGSILRLPAASAADRLRARMADGKRKLR